MFLQYNILVLLFVIRDSNYNMLRRSVHVLLNPVVDATFNACLLQLAKEANTVSLAPRWQVRDLCSPLIILHLPRTYI